MKSLSAFIAILLLFSQTSCKNASTKNSNKIVETYLETAECLIGEWEIEDKSEGNIHLKFSGIINTKGDEVNNRSFLVEKYDKNGIVINQASGTWEYKKVGQVIAGVGWREKIFGVEDRFSIKFTNCNRIVVNNRTVYIKL